mmetsp:Transcript_30463/g.78939  ORF Transcript_30463/g.78939 Transcript_30463/m.78939 type:complete len:215 (-) Transcript_30463:1533-2177(-)
MHARTRAHVHLHFLDEGRKEGRTNVQIVHYKLPGFAHTAHPRHRHTITCSHTRHTHTPSTPSLLPRTIHIYTHKHIHIQIHYHHPLPYLINRRDVLVRSIEVLRLVEAVDLLFQLAASLDQHARRKLRAENTLELNDSFLLLAEGLVHAQKAANTVHLILHDSAALLIHLHMLLFRFFAGKTSEDVQDFGHFFGHKWKRPREDVHEIGQIKRVR